MAKWVIQIKEGATYRSTVTVSGIADISSASGWRLTIGRPDGVNVVTATTGNQMIQSVAGTFAQKIINIPSATTEAMTPGKYVFDFDIEWSNPTRVERIYSLGECVVAAKVPTA